MTTELISKTIGWCLHKRAEMTPNHIGLCYKDYRYTWKEIDEISDFLAMKYLDAGMKIGERAAIWGVNSPNWILNYFALTKIGIVPVLINTCFKENELEGVLEDTNIQYLFYGKGCKTISYQEIIGKLAWERLSEFKTKFPLEKEGETSWYVREDFSQNSLEKEMKKLRNREKMVKPEETASILFTSGTTCRPKGVMLSHINLINNSNELVRQMHWNETDKFCLSVPLFHCFGITAGILSGLHSGGEIHLLKYYKTLDVLEQIHTHGCTVLNGVPTMFLAMVRNSKREQYDILSLNSGIIAGSTIRPSEYLEICGSLGMEHLQLSYGQTESSPCITISGYDDDLIQKANSSGRKIPYIELEIQNPRTGESVLADEDGEIITRGYHVMQGYYGKAEETGNVIDAEGWLHTGDIGHLDQKGNLHITGRLGEMIIRGGENISPLEIENCIQQMEQVESVKVVGVPAAVLQEEIAACIIPTAGANVEEKTVQEFVKARLSDYKVPKYVLVCSEFPLNESGKIKTNILKQQVLDVIKAK